MKRILAALLALLTVLSLVACSSSLATEPTAEETKTEVKTEEKKNLLIKANNIVPIPLPFMVSETPNLHILTAG